MDRDVAVAVLPSTEPLTDLHVVQRVLGGERNLFEILMRRYNQRLYRLARAIVKDESEAEDVMQQAYVNAYLHLGQFEERAQFSTWLTRITIHEALARVRQRARMELFDEPNFDELETGHLSVKHMDPERQASNSELRALLESAVESLPENYRVVFVLREVEGLNTAETADCLEMSEEAVKTRLHRARALLREELFQRAGIASSYAFEFHLSRCDRIVSNVFAALDRLAPLR